MSRVYVVDHLGTFNCIMVFLLMCGFCIILSCIFVFFDTSQSTETYVLILCVLFRAVNSQGVIYATRPICKEDITLM